MAKIIFLQNIKGVAQIGDIKDVADGYARNFLIPGNFAKLATPSALKEAEILKQKRKQVIEKEAQENKMLAEKLNKLTLDIEKNANEEGTLYDSLDTAEISTNFKKRGFKIEPEDIKLEAPIKLIGEYEVTIDLGQKITAQLKIKVVKRKE